MLEPNKDLANIFEKAVNLSTKHKHEYITLEHFLYSLVTDKKFGDLLQEYGASVDSLKQSLEEFISNDFYKL